MTRRLFSVGGAIGATLLALACGVLAMPDVPIAPLNTCTVDSDCNQAFPDASASVTCVSGACVESTAFRPIIVFSIPTTAPNGGATYALPSNYLLEVPPAPAGCANIPATQTCFFLPPLASTSGFLQVSYGFGVTLWPPSGLRPNIPDGNPIALPTRAIFHPMWIDPVTGHPVLATKLGLPLPDVVADQSTTTFLLAPTNGTTDVPGFVFSANVPQPITSTDPSAFYGYEIIPSDPYAIFPPFVRPADPRPSSDGGAPAGDTTLLDGFGVAPPNATLTPLALNLPSIIYDPTKFLPPVSAPIAQPITINEGPDLGISLEGWSAYIVDTDGRRVSGRAILPAGATKTLTLYESYNTAQSNLTLIIAPPPTLDMPSLEDNSGLFAPAHTYFQVPVPQNPSGAVQRSDELGTQTSAHITFIANGNVPSATLIHADLSPAPELNYQKTIATDSGGNYSVLLPPGNLRAYVVPDDPNLTITLNDNYQVAPSAPPQNGKTLVVNPRTHVTGRVVLADGTPLFAATVVVSPSADLPLTTTDDPLLRPRETQGLTDVNGLFDVPSDPGQVDISVRPQDGTQFPWVVLTSRTVPPSTGADGGVTSTLTIPTVTIPAPVTFPPTSAGVLTDSLGNPVPNAVVRAYAFPPPAMAIDGGVAQSRGARLLGMTTSDANGNFQLFVAPPDPE